MAVESSGRHTLIKERNRFIRVKGGTTEGQSCESASISGSVSQRACVYCGARVVLNPITDAVHLVHGPIGCASYTWDIRGSLSSGADLYRYSFSTDLRENEIIFGGEKKLAAAIDDLVNKYHPPLVLVYSTCVAGIIGDDLEAVCRAAARRHGITVLPVESSGFAGSKSEGYRAACDVLMRIMTAGENPIAGSRQGLNYLGDYNLAGEVWIIQSYLRRMGVVLNVAFTGDSSFEAIKEAPSASFNIVQCAGSMGYLAKQMQQRFGIPFYHVSFLGLQDTADSLRLIAWADGDKGVIRRTEDLIKAETARVEPLIQAYRQKLVGKKAAVYVGGGFKAISLIKQFRELGIEVVMIGTQTGRMEEYESIHSLVQDGTVILDDANPSELERFMVQQGADLLVGGVKERPLAYKLGVAFIDHNHDRKHPLSGFEGVVHFAREVYDTVYAPVWKYVKTGGIKHE